MEKEYNEANAGKLDGSSLGGFNNQDI